MPSYLSRLVAVPEKMTATKILDVVRAANSFKPSDNTKMKFLPANRVAISRTATSIPWPAEVSVLPSKALRLKMDEVPSADVVRHCKLFTEPKGAQGSILSVDGKQLNFANPKAVAAALNKATEIVVELNTPVGPQIMVRRAEVSSTQYPSIGMIRRLSDGVGEEANRVALQLYTKNAEKFIFKRPRGYVLEGFSPSDLIRLSQVVGGPVRSIKIETMGKKVLRGPTEVVHRRLSERDQQRLMVEGIACPRSAYGVKEAIRQRAKALIKKRSSVVASAASVPSSSKKNKSQVVVEEVPVAEVVVTKKGMAPVVKGKTIEIPEVVEVPATKKKVVTKKPTAAVVVAEDEDDDSMQAIAADAAVKKATKSVKAAAVEVEAVEEDSEVADAGSLDEEVSTKKVKSLKKKSAPAAVAVEAEEVADAASEVEVEQETTIPAEAVIEQVEASVSAAQQKTSVAGQEFDL